MFEKFSDKNEESEDMNDKDRPHIGIIGMTPQDVSDLKAAEKNPEIICRSGTACCLLWHGRRTERSEKRLR